MEGLGAKLGGAGPGVIEAKPVKPESGAKSRSRIGLATLLGDMIVACPQKILAGYFQFESVTDNGIAEGAVIIINCCQHSAINQASSQAYSVRDG